MVGQGETGHAMLAEDAKAGVLFPRMQRHVSCVSRDPRIALLFKIPSGENDEEQRMRTVRMPRNPGMIWSTVALYGYAKYNLDHQMLKGVSITDAFENCI
jgi:hypothetical protein